MLDDPQGQFGYALQWMIDAKRNLLIGYGNTLENLKKGNRWRMMVFPMPRLSDGPVVHLRPENALENYCIQDLDARFPSQQIGQGACVYKGKMLIPVGLGTKKQPSIFYVWDLKKKRLDHVLDLQQQVPAEFEDCDIYHGTVLIQTNGMGVIQMR